MTPFPNITIFLPSLEGGGAERSTVLLANGLVDYGRSVTLLLAQAKGPNLSIVDPRVQVIDLKARGAGRALFPLVKYLRKRRPPILLSVMSHANIVALAARDLSLVKTKVVISERASVAQSIDHGRSSWRQAITMLIARLYYWRANAIVAVSHSVGLELIDVLRVPARLVHVIYNPIVDVSIVRLADEHPEHPWFLSQRPLVVAVGRLTHDKGIDVLIDALALLRDRCDARVLVLGEGEDRAALQAQICQLGLGDRVALPGYCDNPYAAMARAAVFVLPSRSEGLPGALVQAMATGVQVIATRTRGGSAEILQDGKWGRLVLPDAPAELASAIYDALNLRSAVDPRPRASDFSVERSVAAYIHLFDELFPAGPQSR